MALFKTDGNFSESRKQVTSKNSRDAFLNEFLNDLISSSSASDFKKDFSPAINIREEDQAYFVETELPGVDKKDITIDIKNDHLILSGEKRSFNEEQKSGYHHIERSHGSFYRTIMLPKDVDHENVRAELSDGVLIVELAKIDSQYNKGRSIEIK